ncbi:OsmC family protein [Foetidibacter luteolus]|uniref:OsmC family protein n=1 Tax=Foetidibacter luteolus TaxID=2608880 RepID=UPI00129B49C9|nr:OsmC family protein [Foetidibacter luteolus]
MTSQIIYKGNLRTEATHLQSNTVIETDAPVDNQGNGERFSPTDIVSTALGSCMLTIMGIKARDMQVNLDGTQIGITKIMASDPRRISGVKLVFDFTDNTVVDEKQKAILERAALTCPVAKSIHPDIEVDVTFNWKS